MRERATIRKTGGTTHPKSPAPSNPRRRGRLNPDGAEPTAADLSEAFHGRPARKVTIVEEIEHDRAELAELGRLTQLHVRCFADGSNKQIPFYGTTVKLGASPDGKNLFFIGGNQSFDLASVGIDSDKDQICIGECTWIFYFTSKAFHNFEPTPYKHKFGEETGERPLLGYSQLNSKFYLEGGAYTVRPEGIVN
jgi:hypothetical protein